MKNNGNRIKKHKSVGSLSAMEFKLLCINIAFMSSYSMLRVCAAPVTFNFSKRSSNIQYGILCPIVTHINLVCSLLGQDSVLDF